MSQSEEQALRRLLENYRLFQTYFEDYRIDDVQFEGVTYNFMDILVGIDEIASEEARAIFDVYIDQVYAEKSSAYIKAKQIADIGIASMVDIQSQRGIHDK